MVRANEPLAATAATATTGAGAGSSVQAASSVDEPPLSGGGRATPARKRATGERVRVGPLRMRVHAPRGSGAHWQSKAHRRRRQRHTSGARPVPPSPLHRGAACGAVAAKRRIALHAHLLPLPPDWPLAQPCRWQGAAGSRGRWRRRPTGQRRLASLRARACRCALSATPFAAPPTPTRQSVVATSHAHHPVRKRAWPAAPRATAGRAPDRPRVKLPRAPPLSTRAHTQRRPVSGT